MDSARKPLDVVICTGELISASATRTVRGRLAEEDAVAGERQRGDHPGEAAGVDLLEGAR